MLRRPRHRGIAGVNVEIEWRLHYPRALVEDIIAGARRKFVLRGFDARHDLEIGAQRVHTGTGGASPHMVDFETGLYRGSNLADLYDIARLVDQLDNIHWFTRSVVTCRSYCRSVMSSRAEVVRRC